MEGKPSPERALSTDKRIAAATGLRVSSYDRVASLLVSMLMVVGGLVTLLFLAWASSRVFHVEKTTPAVMIQLGGGYENGIGEAGMQIDSQEISDLAGDGESVDSKPAESLTTMLESVVPPTAQLDQLDDKLTRAERWAGRGPSVGSGNDSPAQGKGGGSGGGASRIQRFELYFPEGNTVETYARQLDAFGIELAVLAPESQLIYLSKLSGKVPEKRVGPRTEERRRVLMWSRSDLIEADLELCKRAGVTPNNRVTLKLIPKEIDDNLRELERAFRGRPAIEIRRTRFGVRPQGESFEFYVMDQTYF